MAIERVVRCDGCANVIEPDTGFAVIGNIHRVGVAKQSIGIFDCVGGGLVGNNLEDSEVVRTEYYCELCMARLLGFKLILERNCIGTL